MNYKKKIAVILGLSVIGLTGIYWGKNAQVENLKDEDVQQVSEENYTVRILAKEWKDADDDKLEELFQGMPDDQRILADDTGGFTGKWQTSPEDTALGPIINPDGTIEEQDLSSPKAATVGEVKAAIRAGRK
ncbi:hypothetical protein [Streptococcus himalayensis]|uniref:Uncharacterized protein n=1 Tax=Streptococcus himalayensis TaxID=1888195 RepID=A0A917EFS8_9STRE|nr:hypothetical protein [Streptococcus himalayensis]GGE34141.1 hypothetical protein GCM10011510_14390 [Streptococcus himalayensis]